MDKIISVISVNFLEIKLINGSGVLITDLTTGSSFYTAKLSIGAWFSEIEMIAGVEFFSAHYNSTNSWL